MMTARRDVFQAIADPTRREIINMTAHQTLNLGAIAERFDMKRQSIALHIKILSECGLLEIRRQGRETFCSARPGQLNEVSVWVEQYRSFWEKKFDAFEKYFDSVHSMRQKNEKNATRRKKITKKKPK